MNIIFNYIKIVFLIFLNKILGFLKDIIIAKNFGINFETDVFFSIFKIPNLLGKIFTENIFSYTIVPIIIKYKKKKKIHEIISSIYYLIILIVILITILGIFFSKKIIYIFFPGFIKDIKKLELANKILKILFPYTILISLTSFFSIIFNIWNYYILNIIQPIILNITIIIFCLYFKKYFLNKIYILVWSIIFGGILQLIYQYIYINKIPININLIYLNFKNFKIKNIIKKITLPTLNILISQLSQLTINNYYSFLEKKTISWIYYSDKIIDIPLSIFGTIISNIAMNKLSKEYYKKDKYKYSIILWNYIKLILLLTLPSLIFLIIFSKIIILTLFQYNKFTYLDSLMTSKLLSISSIGLIGFNLNKLLNIGFYASNNIKIPTIISLINFLSIQLNLLINKKFKENGIIISINISTYISLILLYIQLKKKKILFKERKTKFLLQITISTLTMLTILLITTKKFININKLLIHGIKYRIVKLSTLIILGTISYITSLIIVKFKFKKFLNNLNFK